MFRRRDRTPPTPTLADAETYARESQTNGVCGLVLGVHTHWESYLKMPTDSGDKVAVPALTFLCTPGSLFDFADPQVGFFGLHGDIPEGRVLRLWADDFLTVTHEQHWSLRFDAREPFTSEWLNTLFPSPKGNHNFIPNMAYVRAEFTPPQAFSSQSGVEADNRSPGTWVRIEDRRQA